MTEPLNELSIIRLVKEPGVTTTLIPLAPLRDWQFATFYRLGHCKGVAPQLMDLA